ncbi:MAG TPA: AAA family ATPase, partial [Burkholderiales bacterium]
RNGVPFTILDFRAPDAVLEQRVAAREAAGGDASEADIAVLHRQRATVEPLDAEEQLHAVTIDSPQPDAAARVAAALETLSGS